MELTLEKAFSVAAPLERAWEDLLDAGDLARCAPSEDLRHLDGEDAYTGTLTLGSGLVHGILRPVDADEDERRASFLVQGRQAGGPAIGTGLLHAQVDAVNGATHVVLRAELRLAGLLADGEVVRHTGALALEDFARRLEQRMLSDEPRVRAAPGTTAGSPPSEPAAQRRAPAPAAERPRVPVAPAAAVGAALLAVLILRRPRRSVSFEIRLRG